jgi:hypothetical protein
MITFIGIDPGQRGALAALALDGSCILAKPLPITEGRIDAPTLLRALTALPAPRRIAIEDLRALHGVSSASTWSLASCCGALHAVASLSISQIEMIEPKAWQALIGRTKPPKGVKAKERTQWHKAQSVAYCSAHWPALSLLASERCKVPHDGLADALCIASACRLRYLSALLP